MATSQRPRDKRKHRNRRSIELHALAQQGLQRHPTNVHHHSATGQPGGNAHDRRKARRKARHEAISL